jgi:NAD-dependent deacetylase
MERLIVFTGAGISAESGIKTFRDSGGLWEEHRIEEVATPEAWSKNPRLVLDFYNMRRKQVMEAKPNAAHLHLVELEKKYDVHIITQNIDDLHERAGSTKVLHLHGEIMKVRSSKNPSLIYDLKNWELRMGDKCEEGSQLRPHIVWFGEMVPNMALAAQIASQADIFVVVGTSLNVFPAAELVEATPQNCRRFFIDPNPNISVNRLNFSIIKNKATEGVHTLLNELL